MRTSSVYDSIKNKTTILDVARILGVQTRRRGREHFGPCPSPAHQDNTPSFTIGGRRPDKFHCFGCGVNGDMFDLVQIVTGCTPHDALAWLADQVGESMEMDQSTPSKVNRTAPAKQSPENIAAPPEPNRSLIDEVYRDLIGRLSLDGWAERELLARGADLQRFKELGYRRLPVLKTERVNLATAIALKFRLGEDRTVPGFYYLVKENKWCFGGNSTGERIFTFRDKGNVTRLELPGLIVPSYSEAGLIQYLKVRTPQFPFQKVGVSESDYKMWVKQGCPKDARYSEIHDRLRYYPPKYAVVSSAQKDLGASAVLSPHFSRCSEFAGFSGPVIVTEGELKADIIAQKTGLPVIALPAVNLRHEELFKRINQSFDLEKMSDKPIRELKSRFEIRSFSRRITAGELKQIIGPRLLLAFDNETGAAVTQSLWKFLQAAENGLRLPAEVLIWDGVKGFDDFLQKSPEAPLYHVSLAKIWR